MDSAMPRRRIDPTDLFAGLAVIVGCAIVAWLSAGYGLGTPRRMGRASFRSHSASSAPASVP